MEKIRGPAAIFIPLLHFSGTPFRHGKLDVRS
jgi:hypothetical protein